MNEPSGRTKGEDDRAVAQPAEQAAVDSEVKGPNPSGAASAQDEISRLSEQLGITLSADEQLTGLTVGDVRVATDAIRELIDEIKVLRAALGPFAEIARRFGWDKYDRDSAELGRHVVEAPAPDIHPNTAYCLTVGAFRRAAHLLDGDVEFDHPAGSTFAPQKRWWQRRRRSAGEGAD